MKKHNLKRLTAIALSAIISLTAIASPVTSSEVYGNDLVYDDIIDVYGQNYASLGDQILSIGWETGIAAFGDLVKHGRIAAPFLTALGKMIGITGGVSLADLSKQISGLSKDIKEFRAEVNSRFDELYQKVDTVNTEVKKINNKIFTDSVRTEFNVFHTQMYGYVDPVTGIFRDGIGGQIDSIYESTKYNDEVKAIQTAVLIGKYNDWNNPENALFRFKHLGAILAGLYKDEDFGGDRDYYQVLYDTAVTDCMFTGEVYDEMEPYIDRMMEEFLYSYTALAQCLNASLIVSDMSDDTARAVAAQYPNDADSIYNYYLQCKTIDLSLVKNELDTITAMFLNADSPNSVISRYTVFKYKKQYDRCVLVNKGTEEVSFSTELMCAERPWTDDRRVGDWGAKFLPNTKKYDEVVDAQAELGFPAKKINDYIKEKASLNDMSFGEYLNKVGFSTSILYGCDASFPIGKFPYDETAWGREYYTRYHAYDWFIDGFGTKNMISIPQLIQEAKEQNLYCNADKYEGSDYYYRVYAWLPTLPSVDCHSPASAAETASKIYIVHRQEEYYSPIDGHKYDGVDQCLRMYFYDRKVCGFKTAERTVIPPTAQEIFNTEYPPTLELTILGGNRFQASEINLNYFTSIQLTENRKTINVIKTSPYNKYYSFELMEEGQRHAYISEKWLVFDEPGTFHIRVKYKDPEMTGYLYSDWTEIIYYRGYYSYSISGSFTGTVGAAPTLFEQAGEGYDPNSLHITFPDDTDFIAYTYEAFESDGISIDASGAVSFSMPGTYHVRLISLVDNTPLCDWYEINAVMPDDSGYTPADKRSHMPPTSSSSAASSTVSSATSSTDSASASSAGSSAGSSTDPSAASSADTTSNSSGQASSPDENSATEGDDRQDVKMQALYGDDHSITVSWDKITGASKYILYYEKNDKDIKVAETAKNKASIKNAKNNFTYKFKLKYIADGQTLDAPAGCTAKLKVYYKPAIKLTQKNNTLTVSWAKVEGADSYKIYKVVKGKLKLVTETTKTKASFKAVKGKTYTYAVSAVTDSVETKLTKSDRRSIKVT